MNGGAPHSEQVHLAAAAGATGGHVTHAVATGNTRGRDVKRQLHHGTGECEIRVDERPQGINDVTEYLGGVLLHIVALTKRSVEYVTLYCECVQVCESSYMYSSSLQDMPARSTQTLNWDSDTGTGMGNTDTGMGIMTLEWDSH